MKYKKSEMSHSMKPEKRGRADVYPSKPRGCDDKRDAPYMAIDKVTKYRSDPLAHHTDHEVPDARRGEYMVKMIKDPSLFAEGRDGHEDY